MTTEGPNAPGTIVSDNTVGTEAWANPGNAASSDDSYAAATLSNGAGISEYLLATNFGFSIPAGATINGITVTVELSATQSNRVSDNAVRIVKGGTIGSTDMSNGTAWPTSDINRNYGGASELWGETWAASDINSSGFGFAISADGDSPGSRDARIDLITITIDYTAGGGEELAPNISRIKQQRAAYLRM